jgi:DNA recombination protein RmuC
MSASMDLAMIALGALLGAILVGVATAVLWRLMARTPASPVEDKSLLLLQQQLQGLAESLDRRIADSARLTNETVRDQMQQSTRIVRDVTAGLTELKESNKQVVGFTEQLRNLQDILKNPKQRGVLGEYYLETLLKNVLPPGSYQMQYGFSNGEIVDAAVFVKDKVIPIDSKFSLENYNRLSEARDPSEKERLEKLFVNDLKNRIVETSKYIRPGENTTDFAFMFIPHEAIYYDLLVNSVGAVTEETENLIQRAAGKYKVIIVSPTSFLAYLQTVLQGLKAMQIEEQATQIIKNVGELTKHLKVYGEYHDKMGSALATVVNHYNATSKEFKKIDKDVVRISGEAIGVTPLMIDKPHADDA